MCNPGGACNNMDENEEGYDPEEDTEEAFQDRLERMIDFSTIYPDATCMICQEKLNPQRKVRYIFCCPSCETFRHQFPLEMTFTELRAEFEKLRQR